MNKHFMLAEVKAIGDAATGEWEAVLSAPTVDRDGEVIDKGAFEPLPESIPIHAYHDFSDPVGRGQPFYDGDQLKARGGYASTPRAQEIRTLVEEGVIANMSVGFMAAEREERDGIPTVTKAELLEASFVSVPSNREAAVLLAKSYRVATDGTQSAEATLEQIKDILTAPKQFAELPEVEVEAEEEVAESGAEDGVAEATPAAAPEDAPDPDDDTEQKEDLELQAQALALLAES